jgi:hypothetical protein
MHKVYEETELLFSALGAIAWVCFLIALIILAGAATRWFVSITRRQDSHLH